MNNNAKGLGFVLALLTFTLLAVACGSGSTATPSSTPESTQTPGPVLPTAQELKQDGQELFSAFFAAVEAKDGAALHGLLEADIREQCTPEQVEQSVAFEDDFPNLQVTAVFVDLEDPNRALAQVSLLGEPEPGLEGFASNIATTFPFPMVREDGKWRLGIPFFPAGEGCPLPESSSQGGDRNPDVTAIGCPTPTSLPTSGAPTWAPGDCQRQRRRRGRIQCICAPGNGHDVGGPLGALPPTGALAGLESATGNDG